MKATISELWETGREIICYDNDEFERPQTISDLKKCVNVLVGERVCNGGPYEVMIDNSIIMVQPTKVRHPYGGIMYILEVY